MKKITLLVFVACVAMTGFSQSTAEKAVADRVTLLGKNMINPDSAVLYDLFSADLSYGHSAGLVQDRAAIVATYLHGSFRFLNVNISDQTIHVSGDNAIVRHVLVADFKDGEKSGQIKFGILMVWHQEQNNWKLLARQAIKL